ncbi:Diphthamide biosynthesis protein 2 [Trichinella pseudospiralis]|uniref:Diphthamide biosynthesis protein 2 n=1 Tax=Trichinella pseudospiralis TaxID=6337 RepID=A0A0V1IDZ9_TRIPS|nr:Diphthamide biosynthesis protein 2 [Trichinella pseudospiralis]KRZ41966.1 Diphthamide biosynthesis protein 2 [Trichinella pseudospiralis]
MSGNQYKNTDCLERYDMKKLIEYLHSTSVKKIAVQFAEEFISDYESISSYLENAFHLRVVIIGETPYNDCCVNETFALKVGAECLAYFGDSCHSEDARTTIPIFVLPRQQPLIEFPVEAIMEWLSTSEESKYIILDSYFSHKKDHVQNVLQYKCAVLTFHKELSLPADSLVLWYEKMDFRFDHVAMKHPTAKFYIYDSNLLKIVQLNMATQKTLRKRLYGIEKAREAKTIGILFGSLSLPNRLELADRMKQLCKQTNKRCYMFNVGQLTVAKLANFPNVQVFIYITCPYSTVLDCADFYRPIVTVFEFEIACNSDKFWNPISGMLCSFSESTSTTDGVSEMTNQMDKCTVSLISGRVESKLENFHDESTSAMSLLPQNMEITQIFASNDFLQSRSWKGLEEKIGETPVEAVIEGRSGLAAGYTTEPNYFPSSLHCRLGHSRIVRHRKPTSSAHICSRYLFPCSSHHRCSRCSMAPRLCKFRTSRSCSRCIRHAFCTVHLLPFHFPLQREQATIGKHDWKWSKRTKIVGKHPVEQRFQAYFLLASRYLLGRFALLCSQYLNCR